MNHPMTFDVCVGAESWVSSAEFPAECVTSVLSLTCILPVRHLGRTFGNLSNSKNLMFDYLFWTLRGPTCLFVSTHRSEEPQIGFVCVTNEHQAPHWSVNC